MFGRIHGSQVCLFVFFGIIGAGLHRGGLHRTRLIRTGLPAVWLGLCCRRLAFVFRALAGCSEDHEGDGEKKYPADEFHGETVAFFFAVSQRSPELGACDCMRRRWAQIGTRTAGAVKLSVGSIHS